MSNHDREGMQSSLGNLAATLAATPPSLPEDGLQIIPIGAALYMAALPTTGEKLDDSWTGFSPRLLDAQTHLLVTGPIAATDLPALARWLSTRYGGMHTVISIVSAGESRAMSLHALAGDTLKTNLIGLEVPPLAPLDDVRAVEALGYITARLRAPGGCPWDREQSHRSLTPYMIEEAYEAVDAIERDDAEDMVEELGDVLLQVVLHSQLAEEAGRFSLADVAEGVNRKLIRRHPHVFGDVTVDNSGQVLTQWEKIKRAEKGGRRTSVLDGVPIALPALTLAQTMGRKAAKLGLDWTNVDGALDKIREEIAEVATTTSGEERREEIGDLFLALTSACRHWDIDAEESLRDAVTKFAARVRRVEAAARERDLDLPRLSPEEIDALWREAKTADK